MKLRPSALLTLGGTLFVSNMFIYLLLRHDLKWHGAAQLTLAAMGAVILAVYLWRENHDQIS